MKICAVGDGAPFNYEKVQPLYVFLLPEGHLNIGASLICFSFMSGSFCLSIQLYQFYERKKRVSLNRETEQIYQTGKLYDSLNYD